MASLEKFGSSESSAQSQEYIVKPGDTLSKIAQKNGFKSWSELAKLQGPGFDPNKLRIGQKLKMRETQNSNVSSTEIGRIANDQARAQAARELGSTEAIAAQNSAADDLIRKWLDGIDAKDSPMNGTTPTPDRITTAGARANEVENLNGNIEKQFIDLLRMIKGENGQYDVSKITPQILRGLQDCYNNQDKIHTGSVAGVSISHGFANNIIRGGTLGKSSDVSITDNNQKIDNFRSAILNSGTPNELISNIKEALDITPWNLTNITEAWDGKIWTGNIPQPWKDIITAGVKDGSIKLNPNQQGINKDLRAFDNWNTVIGNNPEIKLGTPNRQSGTLGIDISSGGNTFNMSLAKTEQGLIIQPT